MPLFLLGVENTLSKKLPPPPKPFEKPINLVKLDIKKPEFDKIIREMGKEKEKPVPPPIPEPKEIAPSQPPKVKP